MKNKILVTGGAGYLGSNLVPMIKDRAIVYDNLLYCNDYFENVEFVKADVTDYSTLKKYLEKVDAVVWLAAIVGDAACNVNPEKAYSTNVEALKYLTDNFEGKIIFISSCSVYGRNEELVNEKSKLSPISFYAETKIEGEEILKNKENAFILRLGTLHGLSNRMRFDLVVNVLSMHAVVNKKINIFGGKQYRPLLSVKEIAQVIKKIIDNDYIPGIYNIASENLSILQVGKHVKNLYPQVKIKYLDSKFEDERNYKVDISNAKKYLKYKPSIFIDDSIKNIINIIEEGRIKNPFDLKYSNISSLANSKEYKNGKK